MQIKIFNQKKIGSLTYLLTPKYMINTRSVVNQKMYKLFASSVILSLHVKAKLIIF